MLFSIRSFIENNTQSRADFQETLLVENESNETVERAIDFLIWLIARAVKKLKMQKNAPPKQYYGSQKRRSCSSHSRKVRKQPGISSQ
jgi:hypothetical protein